MILRSETVDDYNKIGSVTFDAFSNWHPDAMHQNESEMVALARQKFMYDSELSIVAEMDGVIVGHILLVPSYFIVLGEKVKGVLLGPVCALPKYQRTGIGKRLIQYGHEVAAKKGYEFSLLCGHHDYYPKFGYINRAFSLKGTEITINNKGNEDTSNMSHRPVQSRDVDVIDKWQTGMRRNDSCAILFDKDIMDYHSNTLNIDCFTILEDEAPMGYVRSYTNNQNRIKSLFCDAQNMDKVLLYISSIVDNDQCLTIHQPITHFDALLDDNRFSIKDIRATSDAFMICPLNDTSRINEYCTKVKTGEVNLGVISYPPYSDIDV
ncbi:MAG: N-acetyltransferase [Clostridiales bacterium]|nr:N-acetyltransferase [Clostridiales bacterium]